MKHLLLVLNGKGGVGKSFFAVNLVQYLVDHGIAHTAIDTDHENSTLKRFHAAAQFVDLEGPRQIDGILMATQGASLTVTDCRAASSDLFLTYFDEIDLPAVLEELRVRLTLAIPVNHEADSVDQVQRLVGRLGSLPSYLIIRNAAHSQSFNLYETLEARVDLLQRLGGREITMPRMQDWLVEALNRENLTPTTALHHAGIPLLDRQRLRNWQRQFYHALDTVRDVILPGGDHGA